MVTFTDDFNRPDTAYGDLGPNWTLIDSGEVNGNQWQILNNKANLQAAGKGNARSAIHQINTTDQKITVTFTASGTEVGRSFRILSRYIDNNNHCRAIINMVDGGSTNSVVIQKIVGGAITTLNIATAWYNYPIVAVFSCIGDTFNLNLNGVDVVSATDSSTSSGLKAGFGANQNNQTVTVDDVTLEDVLLTTTITVTPQFQWGVVGRIAITPQFAFGVNQKVVVAPKFEWDVSSTVTITIVPQFKWDVKQLIQKTFNAQWNTDAISSRVTVASKFIWSTQQQIFIESEFQWAAFNFVAKSFTAQWQVRELVELISTFNWGVRELITSSPNFKWNVSVVNELVKVFEWGVAQTFSKTHEFDWAENYLYAVRIAFIWEVIGRVVATFEPQWRVHSILTWTDEVEPESTYTPVGKPSTEYTELPKPSVTVWRK